MVRFLKSKQKVIAKERVKTLLTLAEKSFHKNPERSNRYVELARKVAMKARARIPSELKSKFCKHCYTFLQPGVNCRVRTKNNKVVYYCLNCKNYMKFPFLREKKLRKKKTGTPSS